MAANVKILCEKWSCKICFCGVTGARCKDTIWEGWGVERKTTAVASMGLFWRVSSMCQEFGKHLRSHLSCGHLSSFLGISSSSDTAGPHQTNFIWQLPTRKHFQHKLPWVFLGVLNEINTYLWNFFHCSHNRNYSKRSSVRWAFTKMSTICISMRWLFIVP